MKRKQVSKAKKPEAGVPDRIWFKMYQGQAHFSTVKKSGFTSYVPERRALALFLRAQLDLLEEEEEGKI